MDNIKYVGYGYHGGGRPRKSENEKKHTTCICGTASQLEHLKTIARINNMTTSAFVWELLAQYDARP